MNSSYKAYSQALFDLANEKGLVKEFKDNIDLISDVLKDIKGIDTFLSYEGISKKDKKKLIYDSFNDSISLNVLNFIYLLIDKGYISFYKEIFSDFHSICDEYLNIEEGIVYTKRKIDDDLIKQLESKLSVNGKNIVLINKLDDSLISGFKIVLKNRVFDYSINNRIDDLKNVLLKGGA